MRGKKRQDTLARLPHHNIEAEEAVLGSMMIHPDCIGQIAGFLRPESFYRESHRWLYQTLIDLYEEGTAIDSVTVVDHLDLVGRFNDVGGPSAISKLMLKVPSAIHANHYARIVERCAVLRAMVGAAEEIARLAYEETDTELDDLLGRAERTLASVTPVQGRAAFTNLSKAAGGSTSRLEEMMQSGEPIGLPVSLPSLRRVISSYRRKELTIIAAYTSIGKTAFAVNESIALARAGYHGLFFSLEQSTEALADRFKANIARLDLSQLRNGWQPHDLDSDHYGQPCYPLRARSWDELLAASARADNMLTTLRGIIQIDETPGYTAREICARALAYQAKHRLDFVVVDYLTLMRLPKASDAAGRSLVVGDACLALREMAKRLDIHVFLIHQLGREAASKQPDLSMLAQSVDIERHTDGALLLDAPYKRGRAGALEGDIEVVVAKQRDGATMVVDDVWTERPTGRFWCKASPEREEEAETMPPYKVRGHNGE